MKFINEDFLLLNSTAKELYHSYAKEMPIVDYHTHLDPRAIANNCNFTDLADAWLSTDHYKWRLMRANGVDEHFITGNASGKEKFMEWVRTLQVAYRNPLYHWTHMELSYYFGIDELLTEKNAERIYDNCTNLMQRGEVSVRELISKSHVEVICTTDDPLDTLEYHQQIAKSDFSCRVLPTWRADKVLKVDDLNILNQYIDKLAELTGIGIARYDDLVNALDVRHEFFHQNGCRLADHGLPTLVYHPYRKEEIDRIFERLRYGEEVNANAQKQYLSAILTDMARLNHKRGWAQQYHLGPVRNTSSRLFEKVGADVGTDSMGDELQVQQMQKFFDVLDRENALAKSVVYNLNPKDSEAFAAMAANFNQAPFKGKMQYGAAWWLLDHKSGIEKQLDVVSNYGLLATSIGMLTDSRSFLSFVRHDYFRRILCNVLGADIEAGLIPSQRLHEVGEMVRNICYYNPKSYFGFDHK